MTQDDPYSRVDYRRLVAWPERIDREWPFLEAMLTRTPSRRLLDLGCGTGEHARFLASKGFEVVGLDSSPSMLDKARELPVGDDLAFVLGDITEVEGLFDRPFGAAICLGNTLPHLQDQSALGRAIDGLHRRLLPGAPVVIQILNYEKILGTRQRSLPVNVRESPDGLVVFLRLMDPRPDGTVVFTPSTLRYRPDGEPPIEVLTSRHVCLHGWIRSELLPLMEQSGFQTPTLFGTVGFVDYDAATSPDLVVVARSGC